VHRTRRELLDDFLVAVGEASDSDARNVLERLLLITMTNIWLRHPWRVFRSPVPLQITLVSGQSRYALPDYFGRVGPGEVRNVTRGIRIHRLRDGDLEQLHPYTGTSLEVAGTSRCYEIAGMCGVHTQPASTGEALEAISDNAADTDIVVAVSGDDLNGNWTRTQVTLTGTVAVPLGTWTFIDEAAKAYAAGMTPVTEFTSSRGNVTIRKVSGQVEIQKWFPQESGKEHQIFTLYPKPNAADTLAIPLIRSPKRFINDADNIPDLWQPAIWEDLMYAYRVNTGEMAPAEAAAAPRPALADLIAHENASNGHSRTRPYAGAGRGR
jgi:hypothetical protein